MKHKTALKPLILFDIDQTLVDTEILRTTLTRALAKVVNISPDEMRAHIHEYYQTLSETEALEPKKMLAFLSRRLQVSAKTLADVFFAPQWYQQALYPEVIEVLGQLRQDAYPLGLYSQGHRDFQEHKLLANNLMDFFDPRYRFISLLKTDPSVIENLPENTVIIDDRPSVIEFLEKFPNIIPLHIVRDERPPMGEYTLSTLRDLLPVLTGLSHA